MGSQCDSGQPVTVAPGFSACSKMHQIKALDFSTVVKCFESLNDNFGALVDAQYLTARMQVFLGKTQKVCQAC